MPNPTFTWKKAGDEFSFDDSLHGRYMLYHDSFGAAPSHRFEERGALQDGSTDKGYRLDPRIITVGIAIEGQDLSDLYAKRRELIEMFKPDDIAGIVHVEIDGNAYEIEGYVVDGLQFAAADRKYLYQKIGISIKCPDPTWYDPIVNQVSFVLGGGGAGFAVPMPVPFNVGASNAEGSYVINYVGDTRSYPVIVITGPVTNFVIMNKTSGDKLDFAGFTLAVGKTMTIDTRYGYKTITDELGTNLIDKLTSDSDLATFAILPHPTVMNGVNSFYVSGENISAATSVGLQFYDRFIGI